MSRTNLIALALILGFTGCEPVEGPIGPEGPQGEQGEQGEQGPRGEPGTANVIYSDWTPFQTSDWSEPFSFFGQNRRSYTIAEDSITSEIINTGTVMVFVKFFYDTDVIHTLPIIMALIGRENQVLDYHIQVGEIVIVFYNLNDTDDPGTIGGDSNQYRYVIIPGGTSLLKTRGVESYKDLSYKEFCKKFNIPE